MANWYSTSSPKSTISSEEGTLSCQMHQNSSTLESSERRKGMASLAAMSLTALRSLPGAPAVAVGAAVGVLVLFVFVEGGEAGVLAGEEGVRGVTAGSALGKEEAPP